MDKGLARGLETWGPVSDEATKAEFQASDFARSNEGGVGTVEA